MDGSLIARALMDPDPRVQDTGGIDLVRGLQQRYGRSQSLLGGCSPDLTTEDLLARVVEKVVTCIDQYEERGRFWAWVHSIVLNEARDLRRESPEFPRTSMVAANAPFLCAVHEMLTHTGSATHLRRIRKAFRSLSRRDQLLLQRTARRWPEKPPDRVIARGLRMPEPLIRRYRYVAVRRFKHALQRVSGKRALGTAEEPRLP